MKKIWLILTSLSFILSVIGIWHALPMHVVGDEEALIGGALTMIELKTLIPSLHPTDFASLYYPPLISYLILIAIAPVVFIKFILLGFSAGALQDYFALNQVGIWISARVLSALFAAGTVAVLFQIAKRLFNEKIAWLSSLFLLTSFFHVVVSHWVRHWTFTTFFVYAAVLAWILVVERMKDSNYELRITNYALLPSFLGGLGFGISYLGGLGFFVGLAYVWFKRNEVVHFKKIIVSNIFVFGILACIFALLNIQEVYRMISPVDGSLSDPKSVEGLFAMFKVIGSIVLRQELIISVFGLLGLFVVGRSYRSTVNTIIVWIAFYALLIYGAFHLELRYVYLMIPAVCLLAGLTLNRFMDWIPRGFWNVAFMCLVFIWPVTSVLRYEQLLLKEDTREQAVEWIRENIQPNEPFVMSSETMMLPRTTEAIEKDQAMGRVRASERYTLANYQLPITNYQLRFNYYNMHFWNENLLQGEIDEFIEREQPTYFIVDYWSKEKLTDRERGFMSRGVLVQRFNQSHLGENYDMNGNFFRFNAILFKLYRLGPTVEVYRL